MHGDLDPRGLYKAHVLTSWAQFVGFDRRHDISGKAIYKSVYQWSLYLVNYIIGCVCVHVCVWHLHMNAQSYSHVVPEWLEEYEVESEFCLHC